VAFNTNIILTAHYQYKHTTYTSAHTTYFTILNNALTAEMSCFPTKITRGKQSRIHSWQEKVAQLKSIYMFGLLFIILILTL